MKFLSIKEALETTGFWEGEINNKRKNGECFTTYARISAMRDEEGELISFVSTQHDITEQLEKNRKIMEQSEELERKNAALSEVLGQLEIEKTQIKKDIV